MKDLIINFWNRKKDILHFIGFTTAIGAIFLAIPLPANERAQQALITVQFLWLLIITISIIIFAVIFTAYAYKLNFDIEKEYKWDTQHVIGFPVFIIFSTLIYNLWQYLFALYPTQWKSLMSNFLIVGVGLIVGYYETLKRIYLKITGPYKRLIISSLFLILFSAIFSLWTQLAKLNFDLMNFFQISINFMLLGFLMHLLYLIKLFFIKNKKVVEKN